MTLSILASVVLVFSALVTSTVSAITGMGGGVLLFTVMTLFLTIDQIVPIHGLVQLGSNTSRLYYLKAKILKKFCLPFSIGALIGVAIAVWLKQTITIPPEYPLGLIAGLILYVVFKPKKLPTLKIPPGAFFFLGVFAGVLGIFIGTVGPFLAVFFVRDDLTKEEIVANKAFMQAFIHVLKIPAFLTLGFAYMDYMLITTLMVLVTFIGSKIGVEILKKIDKRTFMYLFKGLLLIAAIRIIIKIGME